MPHTLSEIAEVIDAELHGDPSSLITGVASLQDAKQGDLSFLANKRYRSHLANTGASAVILSLSEQKSCPTNSLVCIDPYLAFAKAVRFLHPDIPHVPGIDASATISDSATVSTSAYIGTHVSIGDNVQIDDNVYIGPGCIINENTVVGKDSKLIANVVLCKGVRVGERVLLHPGVVIGADGFGIANDAGHWLKIPQLGSVEICDDVEIGANTTIDRGALADTVIETGVKIDNQVQIGHNTRIGAHTAIAGCAVIAGSVTIGKRCMIGGATAITGHIEITDDVIITGMSGVSNSIKSPGTYSSALIITDNKTWRRNIARFRKLDKLAKRLEKLEALIKTTE